MLGGGGVRRRLLKHLCCNPDACSGVVELLKGSYKRIVERFVVVYVLQGSLLVVLKGSWLFIASHQRGLLEGTLGGDSWRKIGPLRWHAPILPL